MSHEHESSNPMQPQSFWTFKARLNDTEKLFDSVEFPWQTLNRPEMREKILSIGAYYKGEFKISIDLRGDDKRHILVRRLARDFVVNGPEIGRKIIWLLGWQKTIRGKNERSVIHLLPNGSMELKDK